MLAIAPTGIEIIPFWSICSNHFEKIFFSKEQVHSIADLAVLLVVK